MIMAMRSRVPIDQQVAGGSVANALLRRPGLEVHDVDGCDVVELHEAMGASVKRARKGEGPSILVARVPRLAPHSNSDDQRKYRSQEELDREKERDPFVRFQRWLSEEQKVAKSEIEKVLQRAAAKVEAAARKAEEFPFPKHADEFLFADFSIASTTPKQQGEKIVMVDAINRALSEEMERDAGVVVFGEDVAHGKGGVFGATRGLTDAFGVARCFNTPLAEATIVGIALGLAFDGVHRPVAEIQFADYLWPGFDMLASEMATIHYRSGGQWQVPAVLRMPCGGYIQGGVYHSHSIEGVLASVPGLKVVIPSNAADAKGLLKASIRDPNPVVFLEHKALYRQAKFCARLDPGPDYLLELGKAAIVQEGQDLTLVGWGMMVVMAADLVAKFAKEDVHIELIDLRTIVPADIDTIVTSVKKTGKLLVAQEAPRTCGFAGEIAAQVAEAVFEYLDGPIVRITGQDRPVPYSKPLEDEILPQPEDLEKGIRKLLSY